MKTLFFTALMSALPMLGFGQNPFAEGMTWRTKITGTSTPEPQSVVEVARLEGTENVDGVEAMRMYCWNEGMENSKKLTAYIRTDGDKVYFKPVSSDLKDWYLMYDFDLGSGSGCYVYSPVYQTDGEKPRKWYVKCTGQGKDETGKYPVMNIEEFEDETCTVSFGTGEWIKGVSSKAGVNYNVGFNSDGIGTQLLEARNGNNVLYATGTAAISSASGTSPNISINGRRVSFSDLKDADEIKVYTLDGKIVSECRAMDNSADLYIPQDGTYILKCGEVSKTVSVASCCGY